MDKRLVKTLLRIYHAHESYFREGSALNHFCVEYGIGARKGQSWYFSNAHKREIGEILKGKYGIDPQTTSAESWDSLSRSQSLLIGRDEKFAGQAVTEGRLKLKSLSGKPLKVAGGCWMLPNRADIEVDLHAVFQHPVNHDAILVIENLQTFYDIHCVDTKLLDRLQAHNPLIVYRGDAQGGVKTNAVHALIEKCNLPVTAFVDFDPAGMLIASALPKLDAILSPSLPELEFLVRQYGITERYQEQVAKSSRALEALQENQIIGPVWHTIYAAGKALAQEFFHRLDQQAF